ncbi:MAG: hypothetical protein AAFR59_19555 [Bacteroidota bacterium]
MKTSLYVAMLCLALSLLWACEKQAPTPTVPQADAISTSQTADVDITPWNQVISLEEGKARIAKWKEHWKRDDVPQAFKISKATLDKAMKEDVGIRVYYGLSEKAFNKTLTPGNKDLDITLILVRVNGQMNDKRDVIYTSIDRAGNIAFLDNLTVKEYTSNWRAYQRISKRKTTVACSAEEGCGAGSHTSYSPQPCGSSYGSDEVFTVPLASAFSRISIQEFTEGMASDAELAFSLGITSDNAFDIMLQTLGGASKNEAETYLDLSTPCPTVCGSGTGFSEFQRP